MPALPLTSEAVKNHFRAHHITLPSVVSGNPSNVGKFLMQTPSSQLVSATSSTSTIGARTATLSPTFTPVLAPQLPALRPTATPLSVPPALFLAASNDQADVDFQRKVSDEYSKYIDGIVGAIGMAHSMWKLQAFLRDVVIHGPTALGGRIQGPALEPLILASGPQFGLFDWAGPYTRAIATGIQRCWRAWEEQVKVPGMPWYPAFAAFPGPMAPPMPNVPTPLIALPSASVSKLTMPSHMKSEMSAALGSSGPSSAQLFDALATAMALAVTMWLPSQMVMNVMGKGPVPSFAPPYVPVGPVVGGDIIPVPGHFMA